LKLKNLIILSALTASSVYAVEGTFTSSSGTSMDFDYVNDYPYSRCSSEGIFEVFCKKIGYVYGLEEQKYGELLGKFGDNQKLEDNYAIADNFTWYIPTAEQLQYLADAGAIDKSKLYLISDDNNNDSTDYDIGYFTSGYDTGIEMSDQLVSGLFVAVDLDNPSSPENPGEKPVNDLNIIEKPPEPFPSSYLWHDGASQSSLYDQSLSWGNSCYRMGNNGRSNWEFPTAEELKRYWELGGSFKRNVPIWDYSGNIYDYAGGLYYWTSQGGLALDVDTGEIVTHATAGYPICVSRH